ncbi:MAG: class I SAM-dependent methyltransferase [Ginsengibacter sp.]
MQLQDTIKLIQNKKINAETKTLWADLGCGSGLFTNVLANLLNKESIIYAIDKNISVFKKINIFDDRNIELVELDFEKATLPFANLDGILTANSLHFVKGKKNFLARVKSNLNDKGVFVIVEYDVETGNHWVPYPISFLALKELFNNMGYTVTKINERPSIFNRGNIYSTIIKR